MVTKKDNSIAQQAKGLEIIHSLLTMTPCNDNSQWPRIVKKKKTHTAHIWRSL